MAEEQNTRELPVVDQPIGVPSDYAEHATLMMDLLALAYQTDLTRISTFMLAREVSGRAYPEIGVPDSHHPLSHHQDEPAKLRRLHLINEYHFQQFAYLVAKLDAIPEGDGSRLDSTLFLYDDVGGVVTSADGPEAGVWVIAETTDLPTKLARIVVTDDEGRYVVPDLPEARYELFVRGYGLLDSARVPAGPGDQVDIEATLAPDARAAAQVYPAGWWLTMVEPPADPAAQLDFALTMKQCYDCHQVGNKATRELLPAMRGAGSWLDAWTRRTGVGPSGPGMAQQFRALGDMRQALADWTERVAAGEAPAQPPPRPSGPERNLVITLWDWGSEIDGRTDMAAADIRDGTVNANGPVYGVAEMTDSLTVLDPVTHTAAVVTVPSTAPPLVGGFNASPTRSPHYGDDVCAPGRRAQLGRRRPGARVDGVAGAGPRGPAGVLHLGRESLRGQLSPVAGEPPGVGVRPRDRRVRAHRHLLQQRSQPDERRQFPVLRAERRRRVDRHGHVGRDPRRRGVPGLVPGRRRHHRRRGRHRVDRARRAGVAGHGPPHRLRLLLRRGEPRRRQPVVLGHRPRRPAPRAAREGRQPAGDVRGRVLRAAARARPGRHRVRGRRGRRRRGGVAELAGQRPLLRVRPHPVRHDERSPGDGAELSRGVVVPAQGRSDLRRQLLPRQRELSRPHGLPRHPGARGRRPPSTGR